MSDETKLNQMFESNVSSVQYFSNNEESDSQ